MRGCVHIYCGDGKGKTTAAVGLAVRAAGRGKKVMIARFLKSEDSGEVISLKRLPEILLFPCEKTFGFSWNMTDEEKTQALGYYGELLEKAWKAALWEQADMIILDEVIGACNLGFVDEKRLTELLYVKPEGLEVVMTGRNPWKELIGLADYVSDIRAVKHPYEQGFTARSGIEL